uniref:JAZF zinc finger 1 n=1 Tax=Oryctolagus cuniculus TaxID=9986 RepID=A0A5F9D8E8_RABIT
MARECSGGWPRCLGPAPHGRPGKAPGSWLLPGSARCAGCSGGHWRVNQRQKEDLSLSVSLSHCPLCLSKRQIKKESRVLISNAFVPITCRPHDENPRMKGGLNPQGTSLEAGSENHEFMTDAARREQESLKKKIQPKLSLTLSSSVSRGNVSTPPRHSSGSLTPPVTPPITPSSSFRSSTPTGSEYDEEEVDYEQSDSDESWTTESAISSEAILSSMCMNGGEEKPFACPVPGCKKRYKNVNGIKYHAKNGHRTQIRVRKPFKCRCGKSYKTAQGLRHHTINFHPPVSAEIIRKMQQ